MSIQGKLMNVKLKAVIEQLDDNTFVCNNLPDRQIIIQKEDDAYTYTTTFNVSGFIFEYRTLNIKDTLNPKLTPLEKMGHDLECCFFNYVNEDYPKKLFYGSTFSKFVEFRFKYESGFYFFYVHGYWLTDKGVENINKSYIYDDLNDELFVNTYDCLEKFKFFSELQAFTDMRFAFYDLMSTDSFFIRIFYPSYSNNQEMLIKYFNDTVIIIKNNGKDVVCFTGLDVVIKEVKSVLVNLISDYPTNYLQEALIRFNISKDHLTIEDLHTIIMADY